MFYVDYLRGELLRRRARTILALLGLAVGVAVVIAIAALSRGLSDAQQAALDPLGDLAAERYDPLIAAVLEDSGLRPGGGAELRSPAR